MKKVQYCVKGMSCAACVMHVERAVRGTVAPEDEVTVSLLTNTVTVTVQDENAESDEKREARIAAALHRAGYQLVSEDASKEEKDREVRKKRTSLLVSSLFTLALMYLSMGGMIGLPIPRALYGVQNGFWMAMAQFSLTLPVLIINRKFFKNGFSALLHFAPNMDSLIAVGAGAAVVYGLFAMGMIAGTTDEHVIHSYLHDLYFESAAMILTLVSLGKLLEERAKNKASDAVRSLASLTPKFATVIRAGKEETIPVESIEIGDEVLIRAGEWIPIDGIVIAGEGSTDESALTGESMPVEKREGDDVRAACVLTDGVLRVRAEKVGKQTSLSRIIKLLEETAASKAPISRVADRVSAVFVPCVMAISILTLSVWLILTHHVEQALRSAISVLVISCPCALGLATPTAITVGIGRGARNGILFRSAEALEKLCSVKVVLLDKTGTVTEGKPSVTDVYSYGMSAGELLCLAASVERFSSHPLAQAICRCAEQNRIELLEAQDFRSLTAIGAEATVAQRVYRVGKPDAESLQIVYDEADGDKEEMSERWTDGAAAIQKRSAASFQKDFDLLKESGKTAVAVTSEGRVLGVIGIADRIREDSAAATEELKNAGVTCLMLTGDHERTAAFVAKQANLDGFRANLMPEDKERIVREYSRNAPCAMVGDGINDAPALVRADVGIAIGAGTDVAIDCAGVVLSRSSLGGVAEAILLSRATLRIIKQNLFWALFYNAICIPVAAGVFYPMLHWQLSPMLASAAMSFSSVFVVTNALRLYKIRLTQSNIRKNQAQVKGDQCEMIFQKANKTYRIPVEGMMCPRCVAHVRSALEAVKGVKSVEVSLEEKSATVTGTAEPAALTSAIVAAGYEAGEICTAE